MKLQVSISGQTRLLELNGDGQGRVSFVLDGREESADLLQVEPGVYSLLLGGRSFEARVEQDGDSFEVVCRGQRYGIRIDDFRRYRPDDGDFNSEGAQAITAPMPGKVVKLLVAPGDEIEAGQGIAVVEAMKMQNEVRAPKAGRVTRLEVAEGSSVTAGQTLAVIE